MRSWNVRELRIERRYFNGAPESLVLSCSMIVLSELEARVQLGAGTASQRSIGPAVATVRGTTKPLPRLSWQPTHVSFEDTETGESFAWEVGSVQDLEPGSLRIVVRQAV